MDAALALCRQPDDDDFRARENQTIQTLQQIARQHPEHLGDGQHQCLIPTSVDELAKLYLQHPDARLVEGATDLALEITQQHQPQRTLIHLGQLAALRYIRQGSDSIEIGATTPLSNCEAVLSAEWPQFGALLQRFASLQVRNQASLAGNIANASPIGDTPPVLIALGAELLLRRGNVQRWMKVEEFLLGYHQTAQREGEFILAIRIPRCRPGQWLHVSKVSKRPDDDISSLCAAFFIELAGERVQQVRLAFGGMAATAARARRAEAALLGQRWQHASIEQAAAALTADFQPISDLRGSAAWRQRVAGNLLRRCFLEQQQPQLACRVSDHV
jgi:xanthine dehydrogenase small subunit